MPEGLPHSRRHSRHAHQRGRALGARALSAVILAGGEGTRLRPLTLTRPKPIVPLLNVPFLAYQLALLRQHGVTDVVVACSYMVDEVRRTMGDGGEYGVRLRYAVETTPLGTGGGVRNAVDLVSDLVIVLNGDVLSDLDLGAMLRFHAEREALASLYLTRVEDPTRYGLVEQTEAGRVRRFVEKPDPAQVTTDTISAGVYVLDRALLNRIPTGRMVSIEHEFFPGLVADRIPFFGWVGSHYWRDIGSLASYREAQLDLLAGRVMTRITPAGEMQDGRWVAAGVRFEAGAAIAAPAVIGAGCRLDAGCRVGPFTVLGERCAVGRGATVEGAVLWERVEVGEGAALRDCVIGAGARIGAHARLGAGFVLEARTVVPPGAQLPA